MRVRAGHIAAVGAGVHLVGMGLFAGAMFSQPGHTPYGLVVPALYAVPAAMALIALRGRAGLLTVAAVSSLVLALVPFSGHSLVLLPAAAAYLVAAPRPAPRAAWIAAVACALLLLSGVVSTQLHADRRCYENQRESGCASNVVVAQEALAGATLAAVAAATAWRLLPQRVTTSAPAK